MVRVCTHATPYSEEVEPYKLYCTAPQAVVADVLVGVLGQETHLRDDAAHHHVQTVAGGLQEKRERVGTRVKWSKIYIYCCVINC